MRMRFRNFSLSKVNTLPLVSISGEDGFLVRFRHNFHKENCQRNSFQPLWRLRLDSRPDSLTFCVAVSEKFNLIRNEVYMEYGTDFVTFWIKIHDHNFFLIWWTTGYGNPILFDIIHDLFYVQILIGFTASVLKNLLLSVKFWKNTYYFRRWIGFFFFHPFLSSIPYSLRCSENLIFKTKVNFVGWTMDIICPEIKLFFQFRFTLNTTLTFGSHTINSSWTKIFKEL